MPVDQPSTTLARLEHDLMLLDGAISTLRQLYAAAVSAELDEHAKALWFLASSMRATLTSIREKLGAASSSCNRFEN